MRYVLAILALAISGVLLLLGIGQRTFLAAPSEIVYPLTIDSNANYAVIDAEEFAKIAGQANLAVNGKEGFAAIAKTVDVTGWVEPFDHSTVTVDLDKQKVSSASTRGVKPSNEIIEVDDQGYAVPIDPRGSDLWLETRTSNSGGFRMPIALEASQSLIVAGNGVDPIPGDVSIVWVQDRATPWAGPLLLAGSLFALMGAALYLIAFDRDKRALGPRRGRRGPLLGVRNVVGGSRRRAQSEPVTAVEGDPKRGGLSSAPALPPGASAAESEDSLPVEEGEIEPVDVETGEYDEIIQDDVEDGDAEVSSPDEKQNEEKGDEDAK